MPENIKSYILNKCKEGKGYITLIDSDKAIVGQMQFDEEGMSKTLTERFSVVGYINRLVKYSKKDFKILIDNVIIDELPVSIEHKIDAG